MRQGIQRVLLWLKSGHRVQGLPEGLCRSCCRCAHGRQIHACRHGHFHSAECTSLRGYGTERRFVDRAIDRTCRPMGRGFRPSHRKRRVVARANQHLRSLRDHSYRVQYVVPLESGSSLELFMGRKAFAVIYLLSGLLASLTSIAWNPWA